MFRDAYITEGKRGTNGIFAGDDYYFDNDGYNYQTTILDDKKKKVEAILLEGISLLETHLVPKA